MKALIAMALFGVAAVAIAAQPPTPPVSPATRPADDKTNTADTSIEGAFNIVSGERDGKAIPEAEIKGSMFRIADRKVIGTDKDRTEFFAATYVVDTAKKPWKLDMKSDAPTKATPGGNAPKENVAYPGLVKRDGWTVTLIYALPGGDAPTEFKTKEKQQMFVLQNIVAAPAEPDKFTKP